MFDRWAFPAGIFDWRYALARHRGFTALAIVSLTLAIVFNTPMCSVLDAMINPKLELREPDRLYQLTLRGDLRQTVDNPTRDALLRSGLRNYEDLSYYKTDFRQAGTVEYGRRYAQISSATATPSSFRMLDTHPVAGCVFVDDDYAAETRVTLIAARPPAIRATPIDPIESLRRE